MAWTTLNPRNVGCKSAAGTFSATDVQRTSTGGDPPNVAVSLAADNDGAIYPEPNVVKSTSGYVYGKLVAWDAETNGVTIATGGIQTFTKSAASVAGDIGQGIIGDSTNNAGEVDTSTGTNRRGLVIGRNGTTLFVDLDVGARTTA